MLKNINQVIRTGIQPVGSPKFLGVYPKFFGVGN